MNVFYFIINNLNNFIHCSMKINLYKLFFKYYLLYLLLVNNYLFIHQFFSYYKAILYNLNFQKSNYFFNLIFKSVEFNKLDMQN